MAAAPAGGPRDASPPDIGTTVAADLHHPVPAATGGDRRCDSLAPAEHHVGAVRRRLHPHASCTGLCVASDRDVFGDSACRPANTRKACMIEAVAPSQIVGVPLSKPIQRGTIGVAKADSAGGNQQ